MSRYLLRLGGRVLATALFTGALLLGFVAPSAAGEFINWAGEVGPGGCTVFSVDRSDLSNTSLSAAVDEALGTSCAVFQNKIQVIGGTACA